MKDRTTIQMTKELRRTLKKIKKHKRETYGDTIKRLIKESKTKIK